MPLNEFLPRHVENYCTLVVENTTLHSIKNFRIIVYIPLAEVMKFENKVYQHITKRAPLCFHISLFSCLTYFLIQVFSINSLIVSLRCHLYFWLTSSSLGLLESHSKASLPNTYFSHSAAGLSQGSPHRQFLALFLLISSFWCSIPGEKQDIS